MLSLVLVATLVPLVILVALGVFQFRQDLAAVEGFLQRESQSTARQAARTVALLTEGTDNVLDRVAIARAEGRATRAYLDRVIAEQPIIGSLVVTDATGRVVRASRDEVGRNLSDLPIFPSVREAEGLVVSDVYPSRALGKPAVAMALPVRDGDRFAGMVLARLETAAIAELLEEHMASGEESVTYVTDRRGTLIARPAWAPGAETDSLAALPPVAAALRGESGWIRFESALFGDETRIAGFAPVEGTGWAVVSSREPADQLVAVQARLRHYVLVSLLACVLAAVAALAWARRLTRPLERLSAAMREVRDVGLNQQPYPVLQAAEVPRGITEYETLGTCFNALVAELNQRFEDAVTFQEELQAQNEELQAQTEELQAQSEELQAQTEEIQQQNVSLARLTAEANAASKLKSEFLANMSHELRTPLNSVIGYTELVMMSRKATLDDRSRQNLEVVLRNARHLLSLINDVLDLSKVEAGKMTVYAEPMDMGALLQAVANTAAPLAREKGLEVRVEVAEGLGSVITDETKVRQIVLNLVSNAVKFTRSGHVTVSARPAEGDRVAIAVADTGVGIAPEHQALVFEAFRQVDSSTTREAGGTGLGLAIAQKLARALGGELSLASEAEVGTTFTLTLPRVYAHYEAASVVAAEPPAVTVPDGMKAVVAIDDDPQMLHLITESLKDSPYVVVPASSGESGLQLVREVRPHAVTLDIMMPRADGWQVLRALKDDPAIADIPVIIVSFVDNRLLGFTMGAADYLVKPVQRQQLLDTLDRHGDALQAEGGHCLVVEDDPDARELYRQLLEPERVRLVEAADGREAVRAVERAVPSVVILDLMMPHMDGFEFMAWLRSRPETRDVPVVVVTAKALTDEDRARLPEVRAIMQKGAFSSATLLTDVKALLDGARTEEHVS